jgi:hypothetical protein
MMYQARAGRRAAHVARSQLAVRLGLAIYAALITAIVLRCLVLILGFPHSVTSVGAVLSVSSPIVYPLMIVPAANRTVVGAATLADLTAALILLAIPLPLLGRRRA